MNPDEVTSPSSPSTSTSTGRRIRVRSLKRGLISLEASLPSIPSDDNDWVSPFTLPPLPALKKTRTQLDRSPEERIHNRSGSSAYYAAAWGSPYATPSPSQSPATRLNRNKSLDLGSSPLVSRKFPVDRSLSGHIRQQSLPTHDSIDQQSNLPSTSPIDPEFKNQRRNWLSESEDSESGSDREVGKTPTRRTRMTQESVPSGVRSHHVQESVDTITPETFNGTSSLDKTSGKPTTSQIMTETQNLSPAPAVAESPSKEKLLPSLPDEPPMKTEPPVVQSRPTLALPTQSFNRPKKKVPWNGKSCIIAMPMTDRELAGLPPVLTANEREDIIQKWIDLGYPVRGFSIGDWASITHGNGGASRATFPDSDDMEQERKTSPTGVRIPDQAEWQAWVTYLKEEKLRALGVTPSTSEAAPSTMSPFSSTMSRVSSAYPSMAASPPIPPRSVASTQPRMTHSPFSPLMANPATVGFSALSHRGTPQLPNGQRPMHGYTQSIAIPGMNQRIGSPFDYSISHPAALGSGMRSPNEQFSGRPPFSPGHVQNMQSMGHILTPVNMNPSPQDFTRNFHSNPQVAHIQRQQEVIAQQQQHIQTQIARAQHQRQMSMFPLRAMSTEQLPLTPKAVSPERGPPEIMQPTPRSHRHNLSAALEKGVTDSVAASSKGLADVVDGKKPETEKTKEIRDVVEEGEIQEDDAEQEELPILPRPETLRNNADEKEEIETNPSIAGTPLLLDDQNPFANFKLPPQPPLSCQRPALSHTAQPSLSKLNVQAKEFNPSGSFSGNTFNLGDNVFAPKPLPAENPVSNRPQFKSHQRNLSSLNVDAPVFTPSFLPKPSQAEPKKEAAFEATANIATPAKSSFQPHASAFSFTSANSHANEITPAKSDFDPRSSTFSFTSTGFNVEAPEFKPSGPLSNVEFTPEKPADSKGSIFGDVVIGPSSKPQRRHKNLPTVKPSSREGTPTEGEEVFGPDGRAEPPADRNKRTKTVGKDEDDLLLFAENAPFTSLADDENPQDLPETADHAVESVESAAEPVKDAEEPSDEEPLAKSIEVGESARTVAEQSEESKPTIEGSAVEPVSEDVSLQATLEAEEPAAQSAASENQDLEMEEPIRSSTPVEVTQQEPRSAQLEQPLPDVHEPQRNTQAEIAGPEPVLETNITVSEPAATTLPAHDVKEEVPFTTPALSANAPVFQPTAASMHKPKSTLSALTEPFEFQPAAQNIVPAPKLEPTSASEKDREPTPRKGGLMASRFAASPSPELVAPEIIDRLSSSPRALSGEAKSMQDQVPNAQVKAEPSDEPVAVEDVTGPLDVGEDSQADELDQISNPEDYKGNVSRSGSVVSRVCDMSIEEINAVMKQFEENPDLGVIREDTPVEETPLIDMRLPRQNFRSDAPSPSPRRLNGRLDRPFNPDQTRPYGGLGFEIEGVHQLNYGSGEVSDWNGDLSPGQQDKLEARAHFFDDHVNDLIDNVLESRLAPVERALATIQHAVQSVARKPRGGRRSLSTGNKHSDADDEDDYDAYEGYSHYRSMSPKKRDRRQEIIKAAVIEAMSVAQATAPEPQVDMISIQSALQEMRELAKKTIAQPQQPAVDVSAIHAALAELKTLAVQERKAPVLDTSELSKTLEEVKALHQQRVLEPQSDILMMQTTLNELRQLTNEKTKVSEIDLSSLYDCLAELKQGQSRSVQEESGNLKTILEDVISSHPRLRGSRVEQDHDSSQKLHLKIQGLEAMLKVAEKRADSEAALRREAEDGNDTLRAHLKDAQDQAATHKEASEEAQKSLETILSEKQQYREASSESRDLRLRNEVLEQKAEALESTLDEYRVYKGQIREELDAERKRTDNLARHLQDVRDQARDQMDSRDVLRDQLNRLQQRMAKVMEDIRHDEAEWRKREHDIMGKNQLLQSALDHETNRRARLELDAERLHKEHRESLHFKSLHDNAQSEVSKLANIIAGLQAENRSHQDAAYHAQRELVYLKEKQEEMLASQTGRLQDELEASRAILRTLQSDTDARIARLQGQIDTAAFQVQEQKARHEQNMQKMFENHNHAIRQANQKHDADLEEALRQASDKYKANLDHRLAVHEEKLIHLKNQHAKDLEDADEERSRLEHKYTEKLGLSNEKVAHLESKLSDLQDRFEVTKTAARAAVEAATAKGINLPTPASSVVASPPHRASISSASMSIARDSDLPEKISPRALRETIMVLQDQLQNREQKIDKLEAELAAIDKDAPGKIKERETEIAMLRELLDVRVDDLQELISTLEKPHYDRAAVKDAAIRIRTQIKMEQQLKERAISGATLANNIPASISSGLANLAQSPRAMVAAAAWGNWRRVRDSGVSAVSDFANSVGAQTPLRSSSTSSSLLADIMTPPSTNLRSPGEGPQPLTARPLATATAARKTGTGSPSGGARPLRAFGSQPRTLSGARPLARRGTNEPRPGSSGSVIRPSEPSSMKVEPPSTPLALKADSDFGDDVDEDASPLDGRERGFDCDDIEELVKSEQTAMKSVSPQASRSEAQPYEEEERVVVLEEE